MELSLRGYCLTLSEDNACKPDIIINKVTTVETTGRWINRSVSFMVLTTAAVVVTATTHLWVVAAIEILELGNYQLQWLDRSVI